MAKAPTNDEGMHLLRGATLWQTGALDLQGQHGPLSNWLIGGLLQLERTIPEVTTLPAWPTLARQELMEQFMWQSGANVPRAMLLGRLAIVYVSMLFGAVLMCWAGQRSGPAGLAVVAVLFAFSPNLLASSALATTDAVTAATFVTSLLLLDLYWQRPSFWRWLLAGIFLGLALASKSTALLLLPVTLLLSYLGARAQKSWWRPAIVWLSMVAVAAVVVWAAYGFEIGPVPGLPFPLPAATYITIFSEVQNHIDRGHYAFLLGQRSSGGWWYYFILAFLIKTPAVTLLLLGASVVFLTLRRRWLATTVLWLSALALLVAASLTGLNIGYRHILPLVPLVWLLIADNGSFWLRYRWAGLVLALALAFYAVGSLRQRPHYLAYFNEFVGGSSQGYRLLGDSNIDWGQDLNVLVDYVKQNSKRPLYVSYSGMADPSFYELSDRYFLDLENLSEGFAPANPALGRYAISVYHLQAASVAEPDRFDWFRSREPSDSLGFSILIYDVAEDKDGAWIGHCLDPVAAIDQPAAERLVGRKGLRHITFDCRQTWVVPSGGQPGWYILPPDLVPAVANASFPGLLTDVYHHNQDARAPAYTVYYWPGVDDAAGTLIDSSADLRFADGTLAPSPLPAVDYAQLLGGNKVGELWTSAWEATAYNQELLSIMMHLYDQASVPEVGDGLGFQTIQWQPGDVFIQYHDFAAAPGRYLETALYDFVSGERLPFETGNGLQQSVQIYP